MREEHFYIRLWFIFFLGCLYILAYYCMAKRDNAEEIPQRHVVLKWVGAFFTLLALLCGAFSLYLIQNIPFPTESIGPVISPNMIVRSSEKLLVWGYPTLYQSQCISLFNGVFEFLALAIYCFMFRKSNSKWYSKVWKVVYCILLYMFFVSASDYHYFDVYEGQPLLFFMFMACIALCSNRKKKDEQVSVQELDKVSVTETSVAETSVAEKLQQEDAESKNYERFMPNACIDTPRFIIAGNEAETVDLTDPETSQGSEMSDEEILFEDNKSQVSVQEQSEPITMRFCRHCGKEIDYKSDIYCKYCGNKL